MEFRDLFAAAPLPGTEPPIAALFVERWGVLLKRPEAGYLPQLDGSDFVPGAIEALLRAHEAGWLIYLMGNESAVAHGRQSDSAWKRFESELIERLERSGIHITRNYACLDDPEGKPPHEKESVFFLPNTGSLYHAAQHDSVRLPESWVVSDEINTLAAGWRAGCRLARIQTRGASPESTHLTVDPHAESIDLASFYAGLTLSGNAERRVA